jgi:tripartite-type tricarboxylate transporter receptor subunit TctC
MKRRNFLAGVAIAAASSLAAAQTNYPNRPIKLVVPFAPGGTSEIVARAVGQQLSMQLGQPVVVENKPGGAGTIAMSEVAQAAPDGYTLIIGHVGTLAVNPYAMPKQPYDVNRDFVPVALLVRVPNIFVVYGELPAKNFQEFVALAKSKPGQLNYGSAGNGSAGHLAFEYLKLVTGMDIVHVPYRGTGPQLQDLLGGRLDATSAGTPALLPHIRSGKIRAIAVGTPQRIPALPDTPTVAELGYRDFETAQWYGVLTPKGTPRDIVVNLNTEINKALASTAVTQRFADDNAAAGVGNAEDFAAFIGKEQVRWKEVVERGKIRIE